MTANAHHLRNKKLVRKIHIRDTAFWRKGGANLGAGWGRGYASC